jgi:hypothetical protein
MLTSIVPLHKILQKKVDIQRAKFSDSNCLRRAVRPLLSCLEESQQIYNMLMKSPFMVAHFMEIPLDPQYRRRLDEFLATVAPNKAIFEKNIENADFATFCKHMVVIIETIDNFSFWILALTPDYNSPDNIVSFIYLYLLVSFSFFHFFFEV